MNVLHVSTASSWRGGEQQVKYLLDELSATEVVCHLWSPKGSILLDKVDKSVISHPYTKRGGLDIIGALRLKGYAIKNNIDLIHCHDSHAHSMTYLAASLFGLKKPIIISRRVDFPIKKSSFKKYNHPNIKAILCVSDKIKEIISPSINNKKILHTVHSGIDLSKYLGKKSCFLRDKYNIATTTKIVANVAALAPHKDYETFIKVVKKTIDNSMEPLIFLAIGKDDGEGSKLKKLAITQGIEKEIIFTGYIPDVWKYIHEIDVFLFTSKEEGLGTSLLDALASQVPIVSTNAGGIPEIVENEVTGLSSNVRDIDGISYQLQRVLNENDLQEKLIENGKIKVKKFSKKNTAKKTLEIYGKILAAN